MPVPAGRCARSGLLPGFTPVERPQEDSAGGPDPRAGVQPGLGTHALWLPRLPPRLRGRGCGVGSGAASPDADAWGTGQPRESPEPPGPGQPSGVGLGRSAAPPRARLRSGPTGNCSPAFGPAHWHRHQHRHQRGLSGPLCSPRGMAAPSGPAPADSETSRARGRRPRDAEHYTALSQQLMPGRRLRARDAPPEPGACGCPSGLSHAERLPKVCVPRKRGTIEPPSGSQVTSSLIEIFPAFPRHPLRSSEGFKGVISRGRPGRATEGPSSSLPRGRTAPPPTGPARALPPSGEGLPGVARRGLPAPCGAATPDVPCPELCLCRPGGRQNPFILLPLDLILVVFPLASEPDAWFPPG